MKMYSHMLTEMVKNIVPYFLQILMNISLNLCNNSNQT